MSRIRTAAGLKLRRDVVALIVIAIIGLIIVPFALASSRNYWYQHNIPGNTDETDGVYHNHTYNEMYWGVGATYAGAIYQLTQGGELHYYHTFNGNYGIGDPGTYYTTPVCGNRTSSSHFVDHCLAQW